MARENSVPGNSGADRSSHEATELTFRADGVERRVPLHDATTVAFEAAAPIERYAVYKGQRNNPGLWWSATMLAHVGHKSWFERDHLMLLDFAPTVAQIAALPFRLTWRDGHETQSHVPSYFVRGADGRGVVVDCRPTRTTAPIRHDPIPATQRACDQIGWEHELLDAPVPPTLRANVRWIAGYRHPRHHRLDIATGLIEAFIEPQPLLVGVHTVGDPIAVLPVAYHLLWNHALVADLSSPLTDRTEVCVWEAAP